MAMRVGTTPYRPMERKDDKPKRQNRNRNRNRNRNTNNRNRTHNRNQNNRTRRSQQLAALKQHATKNNFSKIPSIGLNHLQPKHSDKSESIRRYPPTTSQTPHAVNLSIQNSDESSCMSGCGSLVDLKPDLIPRILSSNIPAREPYSLEILSQISKLQQSPQPPSLFLLHTDEVQVILSFLPIFDLSSDIRAVCISLRTTISTQNSWVAKSLEYQITPNKKSEEKTWTFENKISPCKKVILFVTKTYYFGKPLNRLACKTKRRGPINNETFFKCSTRVFRHRSSRFTNSLAIQPGWHEVTMSYVHGLESVSSDYLALYLKSKGMEETKMTEENRIDLRDDYLAYQRQVYKDAGRSRSKEATRYVWEKMDDFDFESIEDMLDKIERDAHIQRGVDEADSSDRRYPLCALTVGSTNAYYALDPLTLMSFLRDGEMSRRIVRLLIDFENGIADESIRRCRKVTYYCAQSIAIQLGSREDVETVQFLVSNLFPNEPLKSRVCGDLLLVLTGQPRKNEWEETVRWMIEVHGYDIKFDYDVWVQNRIEFAEEMIPFLASRIQAMEARVIDGLTQFIRSETGPEESVELSHRAKELIDCFVSEFI